MALLVAGVLLVTGCFPAHPQSTFDAAGPVARTELNLFYWIFWTALFVFVAVEGALIYAVIRFRRKSAREELPKQTHGNTRLEVAWTIAPALVLAVIAVPTIQAIVDTSNTPEAAMEVRVVAHQWWWEFEYTDLEARVVTANELHIPVGVPVSLLLESEDVVHSFWVPKLGGKTDLFPGTVNTMWLQADEADVYYGQCAEFCGTAHAQMRFRVIAEAPEAFDRWVADYSVASVPPATAEAQQGETLFMGRGGCIACHTNTGTPLFAQMGPNLTHLGTRTTLGAGIMEMSRDNLVAWLSDPDEMKPGNAMSDLAPIYLNPDLALSQAEVEALAEYLLGLKPPASP